MRPLECFARLCFGKFINIVFFEGGSALSSIPEAMSTRAPSDLASVLGRHARRTRLETPPLLL